MLLPSVFLLEETRVDNPPRPSHWRTFSHKSCLTYTSAGSRIELINFIGDREWLHIYIVSIVCLYLYCHWWFDYQEGWAGIPLNRFNPSKMLCLSQARIWISHFWDRPVPIFSDVRFSYLALVQDNKITCVLPANACWLLYSLCQLHTFPF